MQPDRDKVIGIDSVRKHSRNPAAPAQSLDAFEDRVDRRPAARALERKSSLVLNQFRFYRGDVRRVAQLHGVRVADVGAVILSFLPDGKEAA